jgi:hypothetical protein
LEAEILDMRQSNSANILWFLAGLGLGTAAGIVMAPVSGAETRRQIGARAGQARQYVGTHGHDAFERGRELYDKGRHLADEAAEMFEEGRRLVEDAEARNA